MTGSSPTSPPRTPPEMLQASRVAALAPAVRRSMYTSVLSITVFSVLLFRFNPVGLGIWLFLRLLVSAGCVAGLGRLDRSTLAAETKIRLIAVIMGLSGTVWGSIPAFVQPEAPEWRAVVILWLFGNQSVVTAVTSPARQVFLAAIGSVTVVGAAAITVAGGSFVLILAALLLLGGAYSVAIFASLHRTVEVALSAQWETDQLAASLAERQAELESTNEALAELASRDSLTGLVNRRAFTEGITGGSASETLAGAGWIGFIDVDNFKNVNDTYGHRAGDEVLVTLARRWSRLLAADRAVVARAGGDEFIVAIPPCTAGRAEHIVGRLLETRTEPGRLESVAIPVTCSMGLTRYQHGEELARVLARADEALYAVKASGRNAWAMVPPPDDEAAGHEGPALDRVIA